MEYTVLQLSFEIFAFKNDIRFWREKKSLSGISRRSGTVSSYLDLVYVGAKIISQLEKMWQYNCVSLSLQLCGDVSAPS